MLKDLIVVIGTMITTLIAAYSAYVSTDVDSQIDVEIAIDEQFTPQPDLNVLSQRLGPRDLRFFVRNRGAARASGLSVTLHENISVQNRICENRRIVGTFAVLSGGAEVELPGGYWISPTDAHPPLWWSSMQFCAIRQGIFPGEYFVTTGSTSGFNLVELLLRRRSDIGSRLTVTKTKEARSFRPAETCASMLSALPRCQERR
jgi:hypothetical protein